MDIKAIKELATQYTVEELNSFAQKLENGETPNTPHSKEDPGDLLSDFIQAAEVRMLMNQGLEMKEAIREFSKRVRQTLS